MRKKKMRFGDLLREIRLKDERELRQIDVATKLGFSLSFYSEIENNHRRPLTPDEMEIFIELFNVSETDKSRLYDLASHENHEIPYDIEDILMHDEVGEFARQALRRAKGVNQNIEPWKKLIWELEKNKEEQDERGDENDNNENKEI